MASGTQYLQTVEKELEEIQENPEPAGAAATECATLLAQMRGPANQNRRGLAAAAVGERVNQLLEEHPELHLTPVIPWGNLWASCYFAMTGLHAIHVLGGIVAFLVLLTMYLTGRLGVQHTGTIS